MAGKGERMASAASPEELRARWQAAHAQPFSGWDFSVFGDRRVTMRPLETWDYAARVLAAANRSDRMLDMDTGGGEKLTALPRRPWWTVATEGYAPNLALARQRLGPLGVPVLEVRDAARLPFGAGTFDLVTNRHGAYAAPEVARVLRPGGVFLTQQVGAQANRRLHELLGDPTPADYRGLVEADRELETAGLHVDERREEFPIVRYADVEAVVHYLKAVPWEIPDFTVDRYFDRLLAMHARIEAEGHLDVGFHQWFVVARKPAR